jgi:HAD superfamily hydrolase (TIGR01549 family)
LYGVIFDMDGVIIDSEPLHHKAERSLLFKYGVNLSDEELHSFMGKDATQLLKGFIKTYQLPVEFNSFYIEHRENLEQVFRNSEIPVTDAFLWIQALDQHKIPMGLASSTHRALIDLVLEQLNWKQYFQIIIGGDEIERGKPCPDIYLRAASKLGLRPEQCIAVEDSKNGVYSAAEAGCYVLGYINPNSGNQDLSHSHRIFNDFESLDIVRLVQNGSEPAF